jgi:hypothetical protein
MTRERRDLIEINALKLQRARWILERAQLRYHLLGDLAGSHALTRIIGEIESERQRWLFTMDDSLP